MVFSLILYPENVFKVLFAKIYILHTGCPRKNDTQIPGAVIKKIFNLQKLVSLIQILNILSVSLQNFRKIDRTIIFLAMSTENLFKPDKDLQYIGRKFVIKNICSEEF